MPRFDELVTPRLRMRRWREADREPFAAMNADPAVMLHFPAPLDRAASDALVDRIEERFTTQGFGLWALERRDDQAFLGFAGLNPMPDGTPGAGGMEVGWRLARAAWGHGYATEAGAEALRVAFGPVGLTTVWSITAVGNVRSQAVMRRLGLVEHSRYQHPTLPAAHPLADHVAFWSPPGFRPPPA
ncbi:Protein N-acetyltransferase, RimJ/RimL family [Friedmanniella luteola]|uniref:Protein N-acetyltransferase, RimJ/RimL family n=1 Tax=Friedmanniella luteola TaxID=546871 RepID=A0A1H1ZD52_9ACTN|nr:GNAT family N-acetyltransferase [Friedmanniella luteola]SDT31628.1 Protein N-acetyltransferase, RimJ/RimL family [Friedmanniella luteola]